MQLLLAIINYLVANGILLGDGIDAFRDFMPEEPNSVVVLHEYRGDQLSQYTTNVHRSVQVKVRDTSAEAARDKALQILQLFISESESRRVDFSENAWGQVYIRQLPFKLQQDSSNRVTYCFNLGITTNILE